MNVIARKMTVDEFLVWGEAEPKRYELVDGVTYAMAPRRIRHANTKHAVVEAYRIAVKQAGVGCFVVPVGATVRVSRHTAYEPDALVYCGAELDGDAHEVPHPVNVVEVLSPTTAPLDTTSRLTGHIEVVGLEHYRIVDPTRKTVIHHRRANSESIETRIVTGSELHLDPPGLVVETRLFFN